MKINYQETKANFDAAGFSQSKIARVHGHSPAMFHQVLNGTYPNKTSAAAQACVETLRKLNVLVEELDGDDVDKAA